MTDLKALIGEAVLRQVSGETTAPVAPKRTVVIRSSGSGVWLGDIESQDDAARKVVLRDARRAWQWSGAGSCSQLATDGPSGGKICAPVSRVEVFDVLEVIDTNEKSVAAWKAVPAWKP